MDRISEIYHPSLHNNVGLPGETYTSEQLFSEETRRLLHASWLCIGLVNDVPAIGDICPLKFAGIPLLIVRDKAGEVRVYHNACAHRGALLASEPRNCRGRIVCPYHSWTYGLDGELVRAPHAGGAGNHELEHDLTDKPRLAEVRSSSWYGLLFVNISGTAVTFDEFIAAIDQRVGNLDQESLRHDAQLSTRMTFNANWKLVVENFVESYHLPAVHPELEKVNPMRDHYQILGGHSYLGQGGLAYKAAEKEQFSGLPLRKDMDTSKYEVFYIYPNLIFGPVSNFTFVIIVDPVSAELTQERLEFFFYEDESMDPEFEALRNSNADFLKLVNSQDIEICKAVQAGRHSPAFSGGIFALPQEATSLHFLKMVAARMVLQAGESAEGLVSLPTRDIFHDGQ